MADRDLVHQQAVQGETGPYERTDITIRFIVYFVVGLLAIGIFSHVLLAFGYWWLAESQPEADVSPLAPPRELPPRPRLQVSPARDMREYRERQMRELSGYGWADAGAGIARLPIDRAKELLVGGAAAAAPAGQAGGPAQRPMVPLDSGGFVETLFFRPWGARYQSEKGGSSGMPPAAGNAGQPGTGTPGAKPSAGEIGAPPAPPIPDDKEKLRDKQIHRNP
ncbi:MAG: hypothetical protein K2X68_01545 [Novosphingobium sp.]|nr:hypothetical protein [Novosphingobium sp.]